MTRRGTAAKHGHAKQAFATHAIGAAVVALIGAGGYWFGVRPATAAQALREVEQTQLDALGSALASRRAEERGLREELDDLRAQSEDWAARVGEARSVNERVAAIAALAESHGLSLHTLEHGAREPGEHFDVQRLNVGGHGAYDRVAVFFRAVLDRFPDVTIDGFELTATAPGSDVSGSFRCDLSVYSGS